MGLNTNVTLSDPPPGGGRVLTVLIAEDEPMISTTISDDLEEAGYRVAGPFGRSADAIAWIERHPVDLAMLDVILRDGICTELAERLLAQGVPFLVFSGYYRGPDLPPVFRDAPWVEKPGAFAEILTTLDALAMH
jgi:DNA-binding response OmpR family regulator